MAGGLINRIGRWFAPRRNDAPPPAAHYPNVGPYDQSWQVGDAGRCATPGTWCHWPSDVPSRGPSNGEMVRVTALSMLEGQLFLALRGYGILKYPAAHFRKLRPCEADFTKLVKRRAPQRVKEPAPITINFKLPGSTAHAFAVGLTCAAVTTPDGGTFSGAERSSSLPPEDPELRS